VTINGSNWTEFDAEGLTVKLPDVGQEDHPLEKRPGWAGNPMLAPVAGRGELKIKVRVVSSSLTFDAYINLLDGTAELTLVGELSDAAEPAFRAQLDRLLTAKPKRVVIRMENLHSMASRAARALDFISSKLGLDEDIYVVGANDSVRKTLQDVGILESFKVMDSYDAGVLAGTS
jgi:anti-anti-sigma factor